MAADETNPANLTHCRVLGRAEALSLHSSVFGHDLAPFFRSERAALVAGRNAYYSEARYAAGGFDTEAFLDGFRTKLAELGGWDTAAATV